MDGLFFFLRRDTVQKEPIIFAMGIKESGEYEIPSFYLTVKESHDTHFTVLQDLYDRGVREQIRRIFPGTDFQFCTIYASRNLDLKSPDFTIEHTDSEMKYRILTMTPEERKAKKINKSTLWYLIKPL